MSKEPEWISRGKSIKQLIKELESFENQDLEVRLSLDDGETHKSISLVEKDGEFAVLCNSESQSHE